MSERPQVSVCHPVVARLITGLVQDDPETAEHGERMGALAVVLASRLAIDRTEAEIIRVAAFLHDIGKLEIPWYLVNKAAPLTQGERILLESHPHLGANILQRFEGMDGLARIVKHHHENYDGTGYPDGLKGDDIPIGSRIIAVVDTLETMTGSRPFVPRRTVDEAIREIAELAGTQFDPDVVDALLALHRHERALLRATFG